jgi:hypothetical protein
MTPTTINNLVNEALDRGLDPGKYVADMFAIEQGIKSEINKHNKRKEVMEKNYQSDLRQLDIELKQIQDKCPHKETTYYGDPSGGSDSSTECNWCGKEL